MSRFEFEVEDVGAYGPVNSPLLKAMLPTENKALSKWLAEMIFDHPFMDDEAKDTLQQADRGGGFGLIANLSGVTLLSETFWCPKPHSDRQHWVFTYETKASDHFYSVSEVRVPLVVDILNESQEWLPNYKLTMILWAEEVARVLRLPFRVRLVSKSDIDELFESGKYPLELKRFLPRMLDEDSFLVMVNSTQRPNQSDDMYRKEVRLFLDELNLLGIEKPDSGIGMYL